MDLKCFDYNDGTQRYYKRYKTIDLVNSDIFNTYNFESLKELLGVKHERVGRRIARDLFTDFLQMVIEDMIETSCIFVWPLYEFGYFCIRDQADADRKDYVYNSGVRGTVFKPKLVLHRRFYRMGREYVVRFNTRYRSLLYYKVKSGRRY